MACNDQHGELRAAIVAPEGRTHFARMHASLARSLMRGALESGLRAALESGLRAALEMLESAQRR